jgi:Phage derived protein Gp49-like (DUF891)
MDAHDCLLSHQSGRLPSRNIFGFTYWQAGAESLVGVALVEELPVVPVQYFKKLVGTEDLWEVRIQLGNDIFRLLGFLEQGQVVVLTNGFAKKSQKTPPQEIGVAEQRKREYLSR